MSKNRNRKVVVRVDPFAVARKSVRDDYVAAMRDGMRQRAVTIPDKRKVADKRACRGRFDG